MRAGHVWSAIGWLGGARGERQGCEGSGPADSQAGAVQVLFALLLAVLAGFAALSVDLGRAFVERQRLQNVADAAALAGSRYLPDQGQAASVALDVAGENGIDSGAVQVDFPASDRISVRISRYLPFVLASAVGVQGTDSGAAALVARSGVGTLSGGDPSLGAGGCRSEGETGDGEGDGDDGEDDGGEGGHGDGGDGHGDGGDGHGDGGDGQGDGGDGGDGSDDGHGDTPDEGEGIPQCGGDGGHGDGHGDGGHGDGGERDREGGDGSDRGDGNDGSEDRVNGGMVPLAVERTALDDLLPGDLTELKVGPGDQTRGNFYALALGARGSKAYERNLRFGFPGVVRVGDVLETQPGDVAGPTDRAVEWRLAADPAADWQSVRPGSPRLLYVGVIDAFDYATGRDTVTLLGFAAFFLEDCGVGADPGTVCGRFLRWVTPGQGGGGSFGFDAVQIVK